MLCDLCAHMAAGVADVQTDMVAKLATHASGALGSGSLLLLGPPGVGQPSCLTPVLHYPVWEYISLCFTAQSIAHKVAITLTGHLLHFDWQRCAAHRQDHSAERYHPAAG